MAMGMAQTLCEGMTVAVALADKSEEPNPSKPMNKCRRLDWLTAQRA